jgi:hypothetical protein
MRQLRVDEKTSDALAGLPSQTVILDEQGKVLGVFSPLSGRPDLEDLQLEPPLSIEETEILRKERTGKPLEEILQRLGLS